MRKNQLPPALVSNLQQVLLSRKGNGEDQPSEPSVSDSDHNDAVADETDNSKPIVLVTNADGIDSPGLLFLVEALVAQGLHNVHVCAPQTDKSVAGHSLTLGETVPVSSANIEGATAYEVCGNPVDCVSLALSGALFSWSKPQLVVSGINKGLSCGNNMHHSGVVAAAREAMICGIPSLSISLNWKKDESQENDFKDAVSVCLPLINAAIRDTERGTFPTTCSLSIEIPTSPLKNKGFKLTKQSMWRLNPSWLAVSSQRHPSANNFMPSQQALGLQLAQLGRDASAAGAARRSTTQKKNVEIESVGVSGKSDNNRVKKYFRLELLSKELENMEEHLDVKALEEGFVAVTPLSLLSHSDSDVEGAVSTWISTALQGEDQA